ncbi:hypothetical protein B0A50_02358 [Salinomyces thailandicus]|uniref:rRNA methyltransferase 1, mitochondrial n=1 Tax=Salinomyces thailandicus TaxID=706561 RepID=A0A4U0U6G4_9PEZI|nr:hypothetical protein B0A50_02358 [Salinomyces thailandica]
MLHESHSKRDEAQQKEPHHEGPSLLAAVYQQIRSLAAMVKDQRLKSGPEPEVFSSSARELVKSINAAVRDLDSAGQDRTKVVAYLLGHLKAMDAYVREAEGEAGNVQVAQKTMIKELGGWGGRGTFVLVLQGERVKAESPMEAWRRPVAATSERDAVTSILARDLQRAALGSEFNPEKLADPSDSLQDVDEPDHIRQRGGKKDYDRNGGIPLSVPYTTAASQFLYGTNVVWAALRARKRKLHHLYISRGAQGRASSNRRILNLALASHIPVDRNPHIKLLDKMSGDRPHNGVVLETSALPAPSTLYLRTPKRGNLDIPLGLVDGSGSVLEKSQSSWRQPFVIMLDGILDPVNLGSILRTAHFYGVDAVAIATNTCAPLSSAVLARASSGACEGVPLLSLPHPSTFIFRSAKAGWRTYASVTPTMSGTEGAAAAGRLRFTASLGARSPLADAPVILMLGAEGEGLRTNLFRQAHSLVSIEGGSNDLDIGLDSLNVGVATGVLLEAFLRKPLA